MITQELAVPFGLIEHDLAGKLHAQYSQQKALFQVQPAAVQRMFELQAQLIAKAIDERRSPVHFTLPSEVAWIEDGDGQDLLLTVPCELREQKAGDLMGFLRISDIDQHLSELEACSDKAVSICGRLMRFAVPVYMVRNMLPDNRAVNDGAYAPYACQFFQPKWVAFDDNDNLLVHSMDEAKEKIAAMQHFMTSLRQAEGLAPYMIMDRDYQRKYHNMFGQLVNQGRALARYQTGEIVHVIQKRVERNSLNRGLSISLSYFDDQALEMKIHDFEAIPVGRIGFDPFYVAWAARYEQTRIAEDDEINPSTRKHLLSLLQTLEKAFVGLGGKPTSIRTGHDFFNLAFTCNLLSFLPGLAAREARRRSRAWRRADRPVGGSGVVRSGLLYLVLLRHR